jgi:hypothetical protein
MTNTAETNRSPADLSARDIAAILANPTDAGMDELYAWMDAYEAEHGPQDPHAARHDELFDLGITGLANVVRMSPHDELERMLAEQIVATHLAAMDCLRRSHTKDLEHRRENLVHAHRLTRAFAMLTRALQGNRAEANDRGVARPSPNAEPLPRERGPLRRQGARRAAGLARQFLAEQPHAKAPPRKPAAPARRLPPRSRPSLRARRPTQGQDPSNNPMQRQPAQDPRNNPMQRQPALPVRCTCRPRR